uniref:Uncharacterized protein n=1 Tax=Romanomermis culicivorax TaxID=13658 RepID=A0A915HWM8_ROMCU
MEIECNMIIAASFGTVRPGGAPQSSPSASICSTATQPFQPLQAPPMSTGVWMPVRCTLPGLPIVQPIPQYRPRTPPINCQQCVMDVQHQEEIRLLELVRSRWKLVQYEKINRSECFEFAAQFRLHMSFSYVQRVGQCRNTGAEDGSSRKMTHEFCEIAAAV